MRALAKTPGCPIHVEHCWSYEDLGQIIRGDATIKELSDDMAIVFDSGAEAKHRYYNCTIDGQKIFGKIAVIRYEDHKIKELHFKQDKILKEKYPELFETEKKRRP